ncbi:MAG: NUDIX domain-containing protein, partial [Pseudomonadota bacterium]
PWMDPCEARRVGVQADLPAKVPKKSKPTRYGYAYLARREDGAWLLERRPEKGLLGGMLGWPGSEWNDKPAQCAPVSANWYQIDAQARHTFTHFHLILDIMVAQVPRETSTTIGDFKPDDSFQPSQLPTLMRKVFDLAKTELQHPLQSR